MSTFTKTYSMLQSCSFYPVFITIKGNHNHQFQEVPAHATFCVAVIAFCYVRNFDSILWCQHPLYSFLSVDLLYPLVSW